MYIDEYYKGVLCVFLYTYYLVKFSTWLGFFFNAYCKKRWFFKSSNDKGVPSGCTSIKIQKDF